MVYKQKQIKAEMYRQNVRKSTLFTNIIWDPIIFHRIRIQQWFTL